MEQTPNTRYHKTLDIGAVNASLSDACKSLDQAQCALGNGDSATAVYRLTRAQAVIKTALKDIRGEN